MRLGREQVLHMAELAKLALTESETELFVEQLSEILAHFEVLNQLDTSAIPATAQTIHQRNVTRPDDCKPSLPTDQALATAPERDGQYFAVKRILG